MSAADLEHLKPSSVSRANKTITWALSRSAAVRQESARIASETSRAARLEWTIIHQCLDSNEKKRINTVPLRFVVQRIQPGGDI